MAPTWASEMVRDVCAAAGVTAPVMRWRNARRPGSSGVTRRSAGSVSVTAGTDPIDQRLTLLHELAHWLGPVPRRRRGRVQHHDAGFYATAFDLYRRYDIPDADVLVHEGGRYPSALRHARAAGMPGADEAWRARRDALRARARTARSAAGARGGAHRAAGPRRSLDPLRHVWRAGGRADAGAPPAALRPAHPAQRGLGDGFDPAPRRDSRAGLLAGLRRADREHAARRPGCRDLEGRAARRRRDARLGPSLLG